MPILFLAAALLIACRFLGRPVNAMASWVGALFIAAGQLWPMFGAMDYTTIGAEGKISAVLTMAGMLCVFGGVVSAVAKSSSDQNSTPRDP